MKKTVLLLTFVIVLFPTLLSARTTATFGESAVGQACGRLEHGTDFDTLIQCTTSAASGGTKQTAPIVIGTVTAPPYADTACDANKAGMIQYTANTMQYCNGTAWTTLAAGGGGTLGTSAAVPSPSSSTDSTSGLFSATASTVSIATAGTERLRVTATGSVGIGTAAPSYVLDVSDQNNAVFGLREYGSVDGAVIRGLRARGTISAPTAVQAGDVLTGLRAIGYNGSGFTATRGGIDVFTAEAWTATANGTYTTIDTTATGTATPIERVRVDQNGNVGIGTTSPKQKLDVNGDVNIGTGTNTYPTTPAGTVGSITLNGGSLLRAVMNDGTGNYTEYLNSYYDSAAAAHKYQQSAQANRFVTSAGTYAFYVAPSGTAGNNITWTTGLYIDNTGRVGVGTSTPLQALDVAGVIRAQNWIYTTGATGWYNETYGGGWNMSDATWIRSYNGKPVFMAGNFDTGSGATSGVGCDGGMGGGYNFRVCGSQAITSSLLLASDIDAPFTMVRNGVATWSVGPISYLSRFVVQSGGTGPYVAAGAAAWNTFSDRRLKTNISTYNVLDKIKDYRAVSFDWKKGGKHDLGVIAQELYPIFPELVDKGDDDPEREFSSQNQEGAWGVSYEKLGALALQGLKELYELVRSNEDKRDAEISALRAELKATNDKLAKHIKQLSLIHI